MKYYIVKPDNYEKTVLPGLKEWTEALRSGEFEQGKYQLCHKGKYCCLGVLSKLQGRLGFEDGKGFDGKPDWVLTLKPDNPIYETVKADGLIPYSVWIIRNEEGFTYDEMLNDEKTEWFDDIREMNDKGFSFAEIADILEQLYTDKQ